MSAHFYDIESLPNIFSLANYQPENNTVVIYVQDDDNIMGDPNSDAAMQAFWAQLVDAVHAANKENFATGKVDLRPLSSAANVIHLAQEFGCEYRSAIGNPPKLYSTTDASILGLPKEPTGVITNEHRTHMHLVRDIDDAFEADPEKYPYFMGYNSLNYDTTMLAWYLAHAMRLEEKKFNEFSQPAVGVWYHPTSARLMRDFNDLLFTTYRDDMPKALESVNAEDPFYNDETLAANVADNPNAVQITDLDSLAGRAYQIRQNWLMSGRHIDVSLLNEKQKKVALKRQLGTLGFQILESEGLGGEGTSVRTPEQLCDLLAYNVSDVVNLAELAKDRAYSGSFQLKSGMLTTYPELVLDKKKNIRTSRSRAHGWPMTTRLRADATSQALASRSLSPYDRLQDNETVSFKYPDPEKGRAEGIESRDILDESQAFFASAIKATGADPDTVAEALADLQHVWDAYSQIRHKNFDDGSEYRNTYGDNQDKYPLQSLSDVEGLPYSVFYYGPDGKPTTCIATFSTGGLHGSEYNRALYEGDMEKWHLIADDIACAQAAFGYGPEGALACRLSVKKLADPIELNFPSGLVRHTKDLLTSGSTKTHAEWKSPRKPSLWRDKDNGGRDLSSRYTFTSCCTANHEDFSSYYPNLLRQMNVFYNPNIKGDRYGTIYDDKQRYGRIMKDPSLSDEERQMAKQKRGGVKLILNTASGAGDATFDNPVRMNNNIIAMRCIGQMFTWRIGQAQSFEGAKVISSNTDGLYTVMDEEQNNKSLAREAKKIGVDIEPEITHIISKDANNRVEWAENEDGSYTVTEAAGGGLAAYWGPTPEKSLSHPAVLDWAAAEYLIRTYRTYGAEGITKPFDVELGRSLLEDMRRPDLTPKEMEHSLIMFQHMVASNPSSYSYVFALTDKSKKPQLLQHYNRAFYVIGKDLPTENVVHLHQAAAAAVNSKIATKPGREQTNDVIAAYVLKKEDVDVESLWGNNGYREAKVRAVPRIDPNWDILIENHAIHGMNPDRMRMILDHLNIDAYLSRLCADYETNWRNQTPDMEPATTVDALAYLKTDEDA